MPAESKLESLFDLRRQFLGFVERRVNDRAAAEDILQTAYLRALDRGSGLRQDESAVAWFYRILRNAIIDHYRRGITEGAARERFARELESEVVADPSLLTTACQCIAALETVSPTYAELLREVDLGEATLASYAESHGVTAGNAAIRAHRARAALRKQLIRSCGACAGEGCTDCTCTSTAPAFVNASR